MGDGDDPPPRVAAEIAEGEELLHEQAGQTRLLVQYVLDRLLDRPVDMHQAARQGPQARSRLLRAPHQQDA